MKKSNKQSQTPIDPKKFYSLYELVKNNIFYWIQPATYERYKGLVVTDMATNQILKATKVLGPRGLQYKIKGSNIIEFLTKREDKSI